jgi:glycosyltransferase involved in cell wall biosynthesis
LVVFHETYRVEYLAISKTLRQKKIPYVILPHGELTEQAQKKKWLKKKVANLLLFNTFINGAAAIQFLSEREMALSHFGKKKFIGTNGVPLPMQTKSAFRMEGVKIVYIGRLEMEIKGLDLMVRAVKQCKDFLMEKKCKLYIYGPDLNGRFECLQTLIREEGVEELMVLSGPILGAEKEKELLSADCFIQTSRTEGMPTGILEAMSYGVPCLLTEGTTLAGKVREYNAGWGCETSADGIENALRAVIEERACWSEKSENAKALIQAEFCWERVAANAVEEYKKLL